MVSFLYPVLSLSLSHTYSFCRTRWLWSLWASPWCWLVSAVSSSLSGSFTSHAHGCPSASFQLSSHSHTSRGQSGAPGQFSFIIMSFLYVSCKNVKPCVFVYRSIILCLHDLISCHVIKCKLCVSQTGPFPHSMLWSWDFFVSTY